MVKAELLEHVKGLGDIYVVSAPFDEQITALNKQIIKYPISVRDASYVRVHGKTRDGTRTCHTPILAKDSPVIVARVSPLVTNIQMAKQAVQAHINDQYPVLDNDKSVYAKWEKIAEEDKGKKPENRRAILLEQRENHKIHKESDQARFLWLDTREDYFNKFVSGDSVHSCQVSPEAVDSQDGTIVNYLWFYGPGDGSLLDFGDRDLDWDDRVLGALRKTSEAGSQKTKFPYTQRELQSQLNRLNRIKEGKIRVSDLETEVEKVTEFLKKLKQ